MTKLSKSQFTFGWICLGIAVVEQILGLRNEIMVGIAIINILMPFILTR